MGSQAVHGGRDRLGGVNAPARPESRGSIGRDGRASDAPAAPAASTPLARQAASLGSFDFLKLLETGPNGEPLSLSEVLASNPDWADQNADQSMDGDQAGAAQPLESSRNPGGGAEPAAAQPSTLNRDRSLLDEALKLAGPLPSLGHPNGHSEEALGTQSSLGRLFSAGWSGNFGNLAKVPSFGSQISKDPSFNSAVFTSLLSQRSEDQAMLLNMLGVEGPSSGPPVEAHRGARGTGPRASRQVPDVHPSSLHLHSTPQEPPQAPVDDRQGYREVSGQRLGGSRQLPQTPSDAVLAEQASRQRHEWDGGPAHSSLPLEALQVELPSFSEELEEAQQPAAAMCHLMARPLRKHGQAPQYPTTSQPGQAVLDGKVLGSSQPMAGQRSGNRQGPPSAALEPPKPLDERVGSLDYLLAAASAPLANGGEPHLANASPPPAFHQSRAVSTSKAPGHPEPGLLHTSEAAFSGSVSRVPEQGGDSASRRHAAPGNCNVPGAPPFGSYHGTVVQPPRRQGTASLPPLADSRRVRTCSSPFRARQKPVEIKEKGVHHAPRNGFASDSQYAQPSQHGLITHPERRNKSVSQPVFGHSPLLSSHDREEATLANGQASYVAGSDTRQGASAAAAAAAAAAAVDPAKSKFLSGLMTGIAPKPAGPAGSLTPGLQLPRPYVKPLPPLPGVPSIQEYQRKLAAPAAFAPGSHPRLEVLPLIGTSVPELPQVKLDFGALHSRHSPTANGSMGRGVTPHVTWPPPGVGNPPHLPLHIPSASPINASGATPPTPHQNGSRHGSHRAAASLQKNHIPAPTSDVTSSGSGDTKFSKRAWEGQQSAHPKRQAVRSGSLEFEARGSEDGILDETGDEEGGSLGQADRKAIRKAKNRASAAASRARREAYTSALELEVQKLQRSQDWLKSRVAAQERSMPPLTPAPVRLRRQLSL